MLIRSIYDGLAKKPTTPHAQHGITMTCNPSAVGGEAFCETDNL